MKFKYQMKPKPLKYIKHALRQLAHALGKALLYLGTPPLCPVHQSGVLTQLHCQYLGCCPLCNLCGFSDFAETCTRPSCLCSGGPTDSSAPRNYFSTASGPRYSEMA
ncbi:uncharacterized protein LOC108163994 [Drosophila miranda]|uniref:uncharacterized protein LOC108163994 n=1 Tax=Drosophila miranda TaxID=7229 RepID=UPI0007E83037|nr:uncharacterized protein LOC108163994 [Drosophila miranda]XP_017155054.1 uncharacterized protein LOC108163994 [Drosophila miranda]XP_017155055.1 uncharacterized protein LOC108163994 [Drosophila miranda]